MVEKVADRTAGGVSQGLKPVSLSGPRDRLNDDKSPVSRVRKHIDDRVSGLINDLEQDDIAPTAAARLACADILVSVEAECLSPDPLPCPAITTSGDGSLHCQWHERTHRVFLSVDASGLARLFTAEVIVGRTMNSRTITNPSPAQMADALRLLGS